MLLNSCVVSTVSMGINCARGWLGSQRPSRNSTLPFPWYGTVTSRQLTHHGLHFPAHLASRYGPMNLSKYHMPHCQTWVFRKWVCLLHCFFSLLPRSAEDSETLAWLSHETEGVWVSKLPFGAKPPTGQKYLHWTFKQTKIKFLLIKPWTVWGLLQ